LASEKVVPARAGERGETTMDDHFRLDRAALDRYITGDYGERQLNRDRYDDDDADRSGEDGGDPDYNGEEQVTPPCDGCGATEGVKQFDSPTGGVVWLCRACVALSPFDYAADAGEE